MRVDLENLFPPSSADAAGAPSSNAPNKPTPPQHNRKQQQQQQPMVMAEHHDDPLMQRFKPVLQARRDQFDHYKNLKDRDFQSLHEELTHLRQTNRDQERIIAILKEEKQRLLSELLQKGKDLQHLKDQLKRPASNEEKTLLDELKRNLAERETSIDELKQEIIKIHRTHQGALEDYDTMSDELSRAQAQLREAEQQIDKYKGDTERLEESIRMLNDEMTARMEGMKTEVMRAQEVGKRDASTEHHQLHDEVEQLKRQLAEAQQAILRRGEDEARSREMAFQQRQAANDSVAEKTQLLSEIRRLKTLLVEVDELKAQIEQYRIKQIAGEECLREELHIALLNVHEEKETVRRLLAEVDRKEDQIAARDREIARVTREFQKRVDETAGTAERPLYEKVEELTKMLKQEKEQHAEAVETIAKMTLKMSNAQQLLTATKDESTKLLQQHMETQTAWKTEQNKTSDLSESLEKAQRRILDLEQRLAEEANSSKRDRDRVASDGATATQQLETALLEAASRERTLQTENESMQVKLAEAAGVLERYLEQINALRSSQLDHDSVRHEALVAERDALLARQSAMEAQLVEQTERANTVEALGVEAGNTIESLQEELQASQRKLVDAAAARDAASAAEAAVRAEMEALKVQHIENLRAAEEAQQASVEGQASKASNLAQSIEMLERDKKKLAEKLKQSETARADLEKSLALRTAQQQQETKLRNEKEKELQALKEELKKQQGAIAALQNGQAAAIADALRADEEQRKALSESNEALKRRIAELEAENERMKNVQMHW